MSSWQESRCSYAYAALTRVCVCYLLGFCHCSCGNACLQGSACLLLSQLHRSVRSLNSSQPASQRYTWSKSTTGLVGDITTTPILTYIKRYDVKLEQEGALGC